MNVIIVIGIIIIVALITRILIEMILDYVDMIKYNINRKKKQHDKIF